VNWSRRSVLKALALAGAGVRFARTGCAAEHDTWRTTVVAYLESLARDDGGYGWEDQAHSHLTPTFAIIGCYHLLRQPPPRREELAEFVRTHHPSVLKRLEQERRGFEFQQIQALVWLGEDTSMFRDKIRGWTRPLDYMKAYEQSGHPVFQSELGAVRCHELLGLPLDGLSPGFTGYLVSRQRANGTFNNTPTVEGGEGHVMNTWWGLRAMRALGYPIGSRPDTIEWLRACQLATGGFTYQPKPEFAGVDDVAYTWAAVRNLQLLGAAPARRDACVAWLHSLANNDGGFADRPGWNSSPMATYYALDALEALGALEGLHIEKARSAARRPRLPADLRAFSIQIEAHGQGSPAEAVDLAAHLRFRLWGAKNAKAGWIQRAQEIADQRHVPVRFFVANEEYGTWVKVPGLGTYSHTSDIIGPAGAEAGPPLSNQGVVSWREFRERRLTPLVKGGGRLIWQFGENEELVRLFLDDSVERGGYAAISTFHFGNPDFTNSEPFLHRWRGRIPYVAFLDAHGPEAWWGADVSTACRTLFLATEPTWEGWLRALNENWLAAVRHDVWTGFKTWMHTGSREVLDYVRAHERDWRWWDNEAIRRPVVSIVVVTPDDQFEMGRPASGLALRVRCAWECTPQGLLKRPLAELNKFTLDGKEAPLELVAKKRPNGLLDEHCHLLHLDRLSRGPHTATAQVQVLETQTETARTVEFVV
jgi:hypothetical protein